MQIYEIRKNQTGKNINNEMLDSLRHERRNLHAKLDFPSCLFVPKPNYVSIIYEPYVEQTFFSLFDKRLKECILVKRISKLGSSKYFILRKINSLFKFVYENFFPFSLIKWDRINQTEDREKKINMKIEETEKLNNKIHNEYIFLMQELNFVLTRQRKKDLANYEWYYIESHLNSYRFNLLSNYEFYFLNLEKIDSELFFT